MAQITFAQQNHLIDPNTKDTDWAANVMYNNYFFGGAESLLDGKNPTDIRKYASGKQDVLKYKKLFQKLSRSAQSQEVQTGSGIAGNQLFSDMSGIEWEPLAVLAHPMNSAMAVIKKQPLYIKCTAIDALAQQAKKQDFQFLKNRPVLDASLAEFSAMLGSQIKPPDAPNNASSTDISNFDLNPQNEDELNFYVNLFYKLRPETAFETILYALSYTKGLKDVMDLETRDQFYYAVSANRTYFSDITGLPEVDYVYPGDVYTPSSDRPDFNDQDFRYIEKSYTAGQVMNILGNSISDEELAYVFDAAHVLLGRSGPKWSKLPDDSHEKATATVNMVYMEFKSWDAYNFHKKKTKNGSMINEQVGYDYKLQYSRYHPNPDLREKPKKASPEEFTNKKYAQQTYTGYWFPCYKDTVFKFKKLEGSYRERGRYSMSPFSININKSNERGAVELCIPIIDDIQKAAYKMQHCIIMSRPRGMFIDAKYLRQAVSNLLETDMKLSMKQVFSLLTDQNIFIGDSEGIDPMEIQAGARPYYDIPGGVGQEIEGYILVINEGLKRIQLVFGTNDALTGQTPSADALVGVQKLMLQSAINALYYAQDARKHQSEKVLRHWGCLAQEILKHRSSPSAKTLEALTSNYKMDILADLNDIPAHQFSIMVENTPTEEEQATLNQLLMQLVLQNRVSIADFVTIKRIFNYKDAAQLLAIRERKMQEKAAAAQGQQQQAVQQIEQMRAQLKMQSLAAQLESDQKIQASKNQKDQWLAQFNSQAQLAQIALQAQAKAGLQRERMDGQVRKVQEQNAKERQQPLFAA